MEFRRSTSWRCGAVFHVICLTANHSRRCDEGEVAAAVSFKAECHQIAAASAAGIRQCVVSSCLEAIAAGIELIALYCA